MRPFHWTQAKSVFVPELDAEHRNLHDLAADLQAGISDGAPPPIQLPRLRALLAAAEDHFSHEERMMRGAHYRLLKWHKTQHDTIRTRGAACLNRVESGDTQAAAELIEFLARWLHDHMAVADRMMAAALRANARRRAA